MKVPILAVLCLASLPVAGKKIDRGVFVSAQALAVSCRAMKSALGDDYLLGLGKTCKLTTDDMVAVGRCTGYIEVWRTNLGSLWVRIIIQSW
jgi:hypothetical protein